jgi:hypothetical protein
VINSISIGVKGKKYKLKKGRLPKNIRASVASKNRVPTKLSTQGSRRDPLEKETIEIH